LATKQYVFPPKHLYRYSHHKMLPSCSKYFSQSQIFFGLLPLLHQS